MSRFSKENWEDALDSLVDEIIRDMARGGDYRYYRRYDWDCDNDVSGVVIILFIIFNLSSIFFVFNSALTIGRYVIAIGLIIAEYYFIGKHNPTNITFYSYSYLIPILDIGAAIVATFVTYMLADFWFIWAVAAMGIAYAIITNIIDLIIYNVKLKPEAEELIKERMAAKQAEAKADNNKEEDKEYSEWQRNNADYSGWSRTYKDFEQFKKEQDEKREAEAEYEKYSNEGDTYTEDNGFNDYEDSTEYTDTHDYYHHDSAYDKYTSDEIKAMNILELKPGFTEADFKKRKIYYVRKYHPDANQNKNIDTTKIMEKYNVACDVIEKYFSEKRAGKRD